MDRAAGGVDFGRSPLSAVALVAFTTFAVWRGWRPVYWLTVLSVSLTAVVVVVLGPGDLGVLTACAFFTAAQLHLLLCKPVRQTVLRKRPLGFSLRPAAGG